MTHEEVLRRLTTVTIWSRGAQRAPHKPLLLLLALAKCARGDSREIPYLEIDQPLYDLLREFGPPRKSYHPEYPFWRLQNDHVWQVSDSEQLKMSAGNDDVPRPELQRVNPTGGLTEEIYSALHSDRQLLIDVASRILDNHFPRSLHEDVLAAVGLDLSLAETTQQTRRDAEFRERVLRAYERRCAVCGFNLRLGMSDVALEAAHIKWHQAGGPDIEANGLALCSLHHKLLDRGAFTVSSERILLVSQNISGTSGLHESLLKFHRLPIRDSQGAASRPAPEFLYWHTKEVFQGAARE